jgi:fatty acid/phospholipid biosynthesis enzyme
MKRFKRYRPYACFVINEKQYALIQIGIAAFLLVDSEGNLLNNGINANKANYLTHQELISLAETENVKFQGYLEFSPILNKIQCDIFAMLRK